MISTTVAGWSKAILLTLQYANIATGNLSGFNGVWGLGFFLVSKYYFELLQAIRRYPLFLGAG